MTHISVKNLRKGGAVSRGRKPNVNYMLSATCMTAPRYPCIVVLIAAARLCAAVIVIRIRRICRIWCVGCESFSFFLMESRTCTPCIRLRTDKRYVHSSVTDIRLALIAAFSSPSCAEYGHNGYLRTFYGVGETYIPKDNMHQKSAERSSRSADTYIQGYRLFSPPMPPPMPPPIPPGCDPTRTDDWLTVAESTPLIFIT